MKRAQHSVLRDRVADGGQPSCLARLDHAGLRCLSLPDFLRGLQLLYNIGYLMKHSNDNASLQNQSDMFFNEKLDILYSELSLAVKWQRPSILIAVYLSEIIRTQAQSILSSRLESINQSVIPVRANAKQFDIPLALSQNPERENSVFAVTGLRWGGGNRGFNAYRALNMRREFFVDYKIRAVFWLTNKEARLLPHRAPDFWAFRHTVVEFFEFPVIKSTSSLVNQSTLALLPEDIAARVKLSLEKQAQGRVEEAVNLLKEAVSVHPDDPNVWMVLGNIYLHLGLMEDAVDVFLRILRIESDNLSACYHLGLAYLGLNHYQQAIRAFLRATRLDPFHVPSWQELGKIYQHVDRTKDASNVYRTLLALDQKNVPARAFFATKTLNSE